MAGSIFPIRFPLVAAIRSFRGAHRARFLLIICSATGLMSVPFATDGQALGLVDAPVGCVGCVTVSSAAAPPYQDEGDNRYSGGTWAYATPGDDVMARTENAITIKDARPFEAPTQIRLHRFLQPYEVIKPVDRHAGQSRIKQAAPNKKQPTRRAPSPPPKDIGVTGTTQSPFAALLPVFTSVQPPLNPPPADAAQLANRAVVKGRTVEIVSADKVNSIDLDAERPGPGQAKSMTASQRVSAQALSVIAGALAGVVVGLFLISWLEIGGDFLAVPSETAQPDPYNMPQRWT
jgi:hypothetical protein